MSRTGSDIVLSGVLAVQTCACSTREAGDPTVSVVRFLDGPTRLMQGQSSIGHVLSGAGLARPAGQDVDGSAAEAGDVHDAADEIWMTSVSVQGAHLVLDVLVKALDVDATRSRVARACRAPRQALPPDPPGSAASVVVLAGRSVSRDSGRTGPAPA